MFPLPDIDFYHETDVDIGPVHASVEAEFEIDGDDSQRLKQLRRRALIERYAPRYIKYPVGIQVPATGSAFQFVTDEPSDGRYLEAMRFHLDVAQPLTSSGQAVTEPQQITTQNNFAGTGAASAIVLTVPATPNAVNQVSGFTVSGTGATAGSTIVITLAGVQGGTQSYEYVVPAGVTTAAPTLSISFNPPIQASGPNTAITLTVPSFGAGNTNAAAELNAQTVTGTVVTIYLLADPGNAAGNPGQYLHSVGVLGRWTSLPIDQMWPSHAVRVSHPENLWLVAVNSGGTAVSLSGNLQTVNRPTDEWDDPTMMYHILNSFRDE